MVSATVETSSGHVSQGNRSGKANNNPGAEPLQAGLAESYSQQFMRHNYNGKDRDRYSWCGLIGLKYASKWCWQLVTGAASVSRAAQALLVAVEFSLFRDTATAKTFGGADVLQATLSRSQSGARQTAGVMQVSISKCR